MTPINLLIEKPAGNRSIPATSPSNVHSPLLKLLMLEDDPSDAEFIQLILRRAGLSFSACVVTDGTDFQRALQNNEFHAVLVDNVLPRYSSVEALHLIRSISPHTAFILVTGSVPEEFALDILQQGADDYILKTNLVRLPSALKNAIAKKQNEKKREELNIDLRKITAHMEEIREKEQRRIAREVHDQLGQLLTGLKMDIGKLKKQTKHIEESGPIQETLGEISHLLDEAVNTVRKVATDIRPSILDDLGLAEALDWKSGEFADRSGIAVHFSQSSQEIRVNPQTGTALFRIYQEILTNIARHANADMVLTKLEMSDAVIRLTVTDNGKGFDNSVTSTSLGLLSMKERAYMAGGSLVITSQPGNGTMVVAEVPLS